MHSQSDYKGMGRVRFWVRTTFAWQGNGRGFLVLAGVDEVPKLVQHFTLVLIKLLRHYHPVYAF